MQEFKPTQGRPITKSELDRRCDEYRKKHPGCTEMSFIGKDEILNLLEKTGATGIWCINNMKDGHESMSFVAADITGKMLIGENGKDPDGDIINDTLDCPVMCPEGYEGG